MAGCSLPSDWRARTELVPCTLQFAASLLFAAQSLAVVDIYFSRGEI